MVKKQTAAGNKSMLFSIGIGVVSALIVSTLLTLVQANLILNGKIKEEMSTTILFAIRLLSVAAGCLLGSGNYKQKHLQVIGMISLTYLIVLVGLGIVLFDGSFKGFLSGLVSVITGGLIVYVIRMKLFGKRSHKVRFTR